MDTESWLLVAGAVTVVVGIVHSVLGEVMIFRGMRAGSIVPTKGQPVLKERYVRILWATWHIVSVLGFAMAAVLISLSINLEIGLTELFLGSVAVAMGVSSALVLYATKGMHPGWIGLLIVAVSAGLSI